MANFKLSMWCHSVWTWREMHTVWSLELAWASSSPLLFPSFFPGNYIISSPSSSGRRVVPHFFLKLWDAALSPAVFLPTPLKMVPLWDPPPIIQSEVPSVSWWDPNWSTKLYCVKISHLEIFSPVVLQVLRVQDYSLLIFVTLRSSH